MNSLGVESDEGDICFIMHQMWDARGCMCCPGADEKSVVHAYDADRLCQSNKIRHLQEI